ncbi:hypothetical protein N7454_003973 [Penicillium verhagenii]|nr:hypothetical protein N7454_003973 [Penicillium verhagenii]
MSSEDDTITTHRNIEAQSASASTLINDVEKAEPSKYGVRSEKEHKNLFGLKIHTPETHAGTDAIFAAKAQLLNQALLDVGMGKYQWFLYLMTSVGWFLDSFWVMSFFVIAPSASNEAQFFFTGNNEQYLFITLFAGLTVGGTFWPMMSDVLVGAGMPSFTGLSVVGFVVGFAVAGNKSVDAMILLESLPASHQFLVAMQGVSWGLGQLVASAVGWAFIAIYTCGTGPDEESTSSSFSSRSYKRAHSSSSSSSSSSSASCHYVSNKGWRYVWWTFGCITLFLYLCRFALAFYETPKFLLARRRDAEATQLVKDIAQHNKRQTWITEASFARIDSTINGSEAELRTKSRTKALVSSTGLAGTISLILLWATMGLTFILYKTYIGNYLSAKSGVTKITSTTVNTSYLYSRYVYIAICAIPGPLVAALLMEVKGIGRRFTGAGIAVLTGLFMLLSAVSKSRDALLAFECLLSFLHFAGFATLTIYTVEVFPTPTRGFSIGVMGFFWGLFGMIACIITTFDDTISGGGPVWFCGAIWIVVAGAWIALPETQANAAA